jgi:signal peptidase I
MEWKPKPWLAALLGLISPPIGMLYVQRPWWALIYFCLIMGFTVGLIFAGGALGLAILPSLPSTLSWAIAIACAVHAYAVASDLGSGLRRSWYSHWYALATILVVPMLVIVGVRSFLWEPYRIPGVSMYPTIPEGSYVVADKRGFGHYGTHGFELLRSKSIAQIARGDLIVFRLAEQPSIAYMQRVVAVPGDHIQYSARQMTLNGHRAALTGEGRDGPYELAEEAIEGRVTKVAFLPDSSLKDYDERVPENQFVVLGDNRDNARDSRYIGMVDRDAIVGRVVMVFGGRSPTSD